MRAIDGARGILAPENRAEIEARLPEIEIAAGDFPPDLVARCPRLRWMQTWSAGTDWLQAFPETAKMPFALTSTSGMHVSQMNEHLFGMILSWARKLPAASAAQSRREWYRPHRPEIFSLEGKKMLIVGFGAIGEGTARVARAFGMKVVGVTRTARTEPRADGVELGILADLPSLVADADIVVDILPYTADTRHLFAAELFSAMKEGALFANIGRGGTVDEAALEAALASGHLCGAVLDVMEQEPLPSASPLWDRADTLLTAHYAGFHPEYDRIAFDIFIDNLGRFVKGEPLRNLVDKSLGY